MLENQLSRWGGIAKNNPAPIGAKTFLVSDSDDTTVGPLNLGAEFPVDKDGVVRVYTTIQAAVNATSAGRGDVVYVLPGYDQSLTDADSWNVASTQIIGLGNANNRPTLRYTAAAGEVGLGANNVRVSNLRFLAAADSIARAVDIDSGFSGITVDNCVWDYNATGNDFRVMLRLGSQRSLVEDNRFLAEDTAGSGKGVAIKGGAPIYSTIRNNYFFGQFDTVGDTSDGAAAIAQDTSDTADTNFVGVLVDNNVIVSTDTAVGAAIRFSAGYTKRGIVTRNRIMSYDSAGTDTVILALAGMGFSGNFVSRQDTTEKLAGETAVKITDSGN